MTNKASVSEFESQRNKLPGDRKNVASIGKYIIELYTDPLGQRKRAVIEVNEKNGDTYEKTTSIWFNTLEADARQFENPKQKAQAVFAELEQSESKIEEYL